MTVYFVNTYDSKGRPFEDSGVYAAAELGEDEALRQAEAAYAWYTERGARVKLLKGS